MLRPGVIMQVDGLEPPNDAVAKALKLANWFMRLDCQAKSRHYRILLEPIGDDWVVVEAWAEGTVRRRLSDYEGEPHSFWWVEGATDEQGRAAAIVASLFEGRAYDYPFYAWCGVQVIWAWIKHLFQLHGWSHTVDALEIKDDSNKDEVCTEVIDSCDFVQGMPDWDKGAAPTPMAFEKAINEGWVVPA